MKTEIIINETDKTIVIKSGNVKSVMKILLDYPDYEIITEPIEFEWEPIIEKCAPLPLWPAYPIMEWPNYPLFPSQPITAEPYYTHTINCGINSLASSEGTSGVLNEMLDNCTTIIIDNNKN